MRRFAIGSCVSVLLTAGAAPNASSAEAPSETHVLFVACTEYDRSEIRALAGPANDVAGLREVLSAEPLAVPPENVVELSRGQEDPQLAPTHANITREFERLATSDAVQQGHQVLIFLAGHGASAPSALGEGDDDPEPDGLDELFLPQDVGTWSAETGRVERAITDDEIRGWLDRILARGAAVWLIADSCHSGTLARGAPDASWVARSVGFGALGIPDTALPEVVRRGEMGQRPTCAPVEDASLDLPDARENLVAMYAASPCEDTYEVLTGDLGGGPTVGMFSLYLTSALTRAVEDKRGWPSYEDLFARVKEKYRNVSSPTPGMEGGGIDQPVLGGRPTHAGAVD